ncbi:hypothetical protein EYF80_016492 [Liparis tanakae]|uniref:Uncharacterized protein n=1 Tax=Liparis tanakae TaxID=230148 RepID=A0A4Z2I5J8_9TELE|nr:hypothetical protein EYF80_016492 [Liparis tanakae]
MQVERGAISPAKGADGPRLQRAALSLRMNRAEARLPISAAVSVKKHVGQMGNVAGCESKSFNLGELPVHRLGGYESPKSCERAVDTLGPASLPGVSGAPLFHDHRGLAIQFARNPSPFFRGVTVTLLRAAVAFAAVFIILRRDSEVGVDQTEDKSRDQSGISRAHRLHGPASGKRDVVDETDRLSTRQFGLDYFRDAEHLVSWALIAGSSSTGGIGLMMTCIGTL